MPLRERISRKPSELWQFLVEEADGYDASGAKADHRDIRRDSGYGAGDISAVVEAGEALILVNNLLMEREVLRKWQRKCGGFAPEISTLASFLEELSMHSLDDMDLPALVISPEERTLWLEQWLSNHGKPEYRRFASIRSVTAISNIIGNLYREHKRPGDLLAELAGSPDERHVLAELLCDYERRMAEKKWVDREHLPGKMSHCNKALLRHKKVILFLVDELDPVHEHALELMSGSELVSIRFDDRQDNGLSTTDLHLQSFHHPREELEQAARQIIAFMTKKNGTQKPSINASSNLNFDDFVILTGDLSLYEPMVASASERFGIPLYTSRGPSLISHPFIRRLLTYLKLNLNDFQIDDVFRVFADNRLMLPELPDHDEQKAPNIRHFSQFCREYNFRTLDEAAEGMNRVFVWLLDRIHFEDDPEKETRRRDNQQRNRDFYATVIDHLDALRKLYHTPEKQTLKAWVDWTKSLLGLQKDLMSREANEARELIEIILDKLTSAQSRLGLSRRIGCREFFRLLELRLKETRERPQERPGGVLLTEIRHLPDVHDKIVFVMGLHEDGFPRPDKPDFLQFRYEQALKTMTNKDGSENYLLARMQLDRLLASEKPRYLSRPSLVAQKHVMPSPIWLELIGEKKEEMFKSWPISAEKWLMSHHETGRIAAQKITQILEMTRIIKYKNASMKVLPDAAFRDPVHPDLSKSQRGRLYPWKLASAVEKARQNKFSMGRYDGVLDSDVTGAWIEQQYPDGRMRMSISRLDTFATSPHEYFFKYVLRLEPLHEYQDDAESNIKGSLLHHILEEFYSETEQEGAPVWPADDEDAAVRRMNRIRRRLVEVYRHQLGNPESPFPGILEQNLERVTRWFLENEIAGAATFILEMDDARPAVFSPESGYSMEHKWSFDKELDGVPVSFRGKIDRIDLTADGRKALIYDYKSGKSGIKKYSSIVKGNSYQLPLYAIYLIENGITEFVTGYYILPINGKRKDAGCDFSLGSAELIDDSHLNKKDGNRRKDKVQFKPSHEMKAFMEAIEKLRIEWIVKAIREGLFHTSLTGNPPWSDFRHINRYEVSIQQQRKNFEVARRRKKEMKLELDRYFLSEPFWEDEHGS